MIPVFTNVRFEEVIDTKKIANFFWAHRHRDFYPLDAHNEIDPDFDEYHVCKDVFIEEPYRCKSTVLSEKVVRGFKKAENGEDDESK
tara:strand:+ start:43 stop:303 length:261 start_codon:yes stop_codon:yes gene_type:complete